MQPTIMIVDDNDGFCHYMIEYLRVALGYVVERYTEGMSAISDIEQGLAVYDLAIVDLSLPDISGIKVIEASKQKNPHIPVIGCSIYGSGKITKQQMGADRFVTKLRGADSMIDAIKSLLQRRVWCEDGEATEIV